MLGARNFSTCAKRQYMAIILDTNKRVVGMGYNGSPPGMPHCTDGACPRMQEGSEPGSNYDNCISVHAEQNALQWSGADRHTLYVNGCSCMTCGKLISGAGLKRLVCVTDPTYAQWPEVRAFVESAGVQVDEFPYTSVLHANMGLDPLEFTDDLVYGLAAALDDKTGDHSSAG